MFYYFFHNINSRDIFDFHSRATTLRVHRSITVNAIVNHSYNRSVYSETLRTQCLYYYSPGAIKRKTTGGFFFFLIKSFTFRENVLLFVIFFVFHVENQRNLHRRLSGVIARGTEAGAKSHCYQLFQKKKNIKKLS